MKISPFYFYQMTVRECALAIEGHQNALERDYNLSFMAIYNATGLFNSKKFKVNDPFKASNSKGKTKEDQINTLEWLRSKD